MAKLRTCELDMVCKGLLRGTRLAPFYDKRMRIWLYLYEVS